MLTNLVQEVQYFLQTRCQKRRGGRGERERERERTLSSKILGREKYWVIFNVDLSRIKAH
jgi:hypothetical protein